MQVSHKRGNLAAVYPVKPQHNRRIKTKTKNRQKTIVMCIMTFWHHPTMSGKFTLATLDTSEAKLQHLRSNSSFAQNNHLPIHLASAQWAEVVQSNAVA